MSYVGGPGFELYVPIEMARHVYLALHEAGTDLGLPDEAGRRCGEGNEAGRQCGLVDAGYYALDALRIEAGRRAWGAELGPDETPWEAGLGFAVKVEKGVDFIGRNALLRSKAEPLRKKLLSFVLDDPASWVWGGEAIHIDGTAVGELSSAGWSPAAGACVGLGYVRGAAALEVHRGTPVQIDLWGEAVRATAWDEAVLQRLR